MLFYSRKKTARPDVRADKSSEKRPRDPPPNRDPPPKLLTSPQVPPSASDPKARPEAPVKPQNQRLASLLTAKPEPASNGTHCSPGRLDERPKPADPARPPLDHSQELLSVLFGTSEKPAARLPERPAWYGAQDSSSLSKRPPDACSQRSRQSVVPKLKRSPVPGLKHIKLMAQRLRLAQPVPGEPALNRPATMDVPAAHQERGFGEARGESSQPAGLQRSRSADFTA